MHFSREPKLFKLQQALGGPLSIQLVVEDIDEHAQVSFLEVGSLRVVLVPLESAVLLMELFEEPAVNELEVVAAQILVERQLEQLVVLTVLRDAHQVLE